MIGYLVTSGIVSFFRKVILNFMPSFENTDNSPSEPFAGCNENNNASENTGQES
jgi:hypothetical protein